MAAVYAFFCDSDYCKIAIAIPGLPWITMLIDRLPEYLVLVSLGVSYLLNGVVFYFAGYMLDKIINKVCEKKSDNY